MITSKAWQQRWEDSPGLREEWERIKRTDAWELISNLAYSGAAEGLLAIPGTGERLLVGASEQRGAMAILMLLQNAAVELPKPPEPLPEPYAHYLKQPEHPEPSDNI